MTDYITTAQGFDIRRFFGHIKATEMSMTLLPFRVL